MPISKRPDTGAWEVVVGHGGQTYRRSSSRWTRAQASEVEAKLRKDLFNGEMGRPIPKTFNDAIERWTREALPRLKQSTQDEYLQDAAHIAPMIEGKPLTDATAIAAAIIRKWPDLSPSTVNRRLQVVARLCNLAFKEWHWLDKPQVIHLLTEEAKENFLTRQQVEDIAADCPRIGPLVLLSAYTGIRIGHLLRLTAANVVDGEYLSLDRSGKTKRLQLVPLHPRVRGYAAQLPIPGISYAVFYKEFKAALRAHGIEARPHDLRHTMASWLIQSGADLLHIRDMLGHSSVKVTERYAHLKAKHLAKAVGRIGYTRTPRARKQKAHQ
ncbi:MAG TPA: site-specific integrase [Vicinamibacterales bacterium]